MPDSARFTSLFFRFLGSGGVATALHWCVMWILVTQHLDVNLATSAGALCGALANYLLQYYCTFQCEMPHLRVVPAYIRACLASWCVNASLFYLIFTFLLPGVLWAQFCTTALVTLFNFYLYNKVVFHERRCA